MNAEPTGSGNRLVRLTRVLLALDQQAPTPAQLRRLAQWHLKPLTRLEAAAMLAEVLGGEWTTPMTIDRRPTDEGTERR